jgi:hypothetical protein
MKGLLELSLEFVRSMMGGISDENGQRQEEKGGSGREKGRVA